MGLEISEAGKIPLSSSADSAQKCPYKFVVVFHKSSKNYSVPFDEFEALL